MSSATFTKTLPRTSQRRQYNVSLDCTIPEVANEEAYEGGLGKASSRRPTPISMDRLSSPVSMGMLRELSGSYDPEAQKRRRRWLLQARGWFVRPTRLYGLSVRSIILITVGLGLWLVYMTKSGPEDQGSQVSSGWRLSGNNGAASMASRVAAKRKGPRIPRTILPLTPRVHAPLPLDIESRVFPSHPIARGLLQVNGDLPVAAHPIYQAIRDAREEWDAKVSKQSKTLQQATAEYRRRYGRAPPKGFEKWWRYVVENNVQLPDEYDQIHADITLFQAFSPRDLQEKVRKAALKDDTFTIRVTRGNMRMTSTFQEDDIPGGFERMAAQSELIKSIVRDLDDLTIVFSAHDTPSGIVGYDYRQELQDHIEDQEYVDHDTEVDLSVKGWAAACPPKSPLRSHFASAYEFDEGASVNRKRFIVDHEETMDLCEHPESVYIHGFTSGKEPRVQELIPIFALSKTKLHSDVLGVPTEQWSDLANLEPVQWEDKKRQELLWRGSNTGSHFSDDTNWRESHRIRLVRMADEAVGLVTTLPSPQSPGKAGSLAEAVETHPRLDVNEKYMDVGFTGAPLQCDVADGTCDEIKELYSFLPMVSQEESLNYKYSIDVDGNAWSARFRRQLATGTLNFKSTIMPEWWTQRIQPWVHYVPIHADYSDLYDALTFFRGDMAGNAGEDALAKDIAEAGQAWAKTHWRQEDMTAYVFRLYLEWGRLLAPNRSGQDFSYDKTMEVDFDE